MFQMVYLSSAKVPFTKDALLELLTRSRQNNAGRGLTGILLHKDGCFMQVLEGEETAVRALYNKIERDSRHRGVLILLQGPIAERRFGDWSMAFREIQSPELTDMPGFSRFMNPAATDGGFQSDPTECEKLLLSFRRSMR